MRTITKTCKVKLNIPDNRKSDILKTFEQYIFALNYSIDKAYEPDKKIINKSKLHKLTYYALKELTELPANYICSARNKACDIVRGNIIKWSNGKRASKPTYKAFSIQMDKRTLTIKNRHCTFSTINGRVKADYILGDYQKQILDDPNYEFRTATLTCKNDCFFLNITIVKPALVKQPEIVMGVDLGIKNIAVTSTGRFFSSGILNDMRRQSQERRGNIQQKGTKSAHGLIRRLSRKENRFSNWILHNISRQIVNEALEKKVDVIAFENLTDIREKANYWRKKQKHRISLWAFDKLQNYVQYKALESGIDTVFVEAKYTSQRCSKCGHIESSNRNGLSFVCKHCNYSLNADYNASKNIAIKAISCKSPDMVSRPCKLGLKAEVIAYC
ncbi:MAG: transposase [Candidatus Omnitrophota bacterium]